MDKINENISGNNIFNNKIKIIGLWIALIISERNGFTLTVFINKFNNWIKNNYTTNDIKEIFYSFIYVINHMSLMIPLLMIIINIYIKITIIKWINIIIGTVYALVYLIHLIYIIKQHIIIEYKIIEILYNIIGLLITTLIIIESIKMIKKYIKRRNKE
jgi:hypothetical protein